MISRDPITLIDYLSDRDKDLRRVAHAAERRIGRSRGAHGATTPTLGGLTCFGGSAASREPFAPEPQRRAVVKYAGGAVVVPPPEVRAVTNQA